MPLLSRSPADRSCPEPLPVVRAYARYLGGKLKGRTNVVWMLGGGRPAVLDAPKPEAWPQNQAKATGFAVDTDWRPIWREMAAGLAEGTGTTPVCLYHPCGSQMIFLRQLIESRPFFSRIPDPTLFSNPSPGGALHLTASRDREGTYAMIYFPTSDQAATIDLGKLRGPKLNAWWFDPRTGFAHPLGRIAGGGKREFKSPAYGPDWVLVLDDSAFNYAAPGNAR